MASEAIMKTDDLSGECCDDKTSSCATSDGSGRCPWKDLESWMTGCLAQVHYAVLRFRHANMQNITG